MRLVHQASRAGFAFARVRCATPAGATQMLQILGYEPDLHSGRYVVSNGLLDIRIALEGILCLIGVFLLWKVMFPPPERPKPKMNPPTVSVIVPARNEEGRIGPLLESLRCQTVMPHEVIVVDDGSSDDTRGVAERGGAVVIAGEPPKGWLGKPWACWQGAQASTGDVLLFLDADTWLEPDGIERLLGLYEGRGLLTVQPYHVTEKAYEQISAFFNLIAMASVGTFMPFGNHIKPGGAFGPCVMCSRESYFRVGGHQTVRGRVVEDVHLAKEFVRHGLPVRCYAGRGIISFRMYGQGWRQLVEGWSKSMASGAFSVNPIFSILAAAWISGCFGAMSVLLRSFSSFPSGLLIGAGLVVYALYAATIWRMLKGIGRFKWWASALFPLPLAFFALIVARSLILTCIFRRVSWRGRVIHINRLER